GVVTRDYLGYEGFEVGVAVLCAGPGDDIDLFIEGPLPDSEFEVGLALGKQVRSKEYRGDPNLFLMYDAIKEMVTAGFSLNRATPLLEGMGFGLGTWPAMAGIGMFGGIEGDTGHQWFDDRIEQGAAMALVLSGGVRLDTVIMHGCRPASGYHTVTKVDGDTVLEIDGVRALDKVAELLGGSSGKASEDYPLFVTFGINRGEKFGTFNEEEYQNRAIKAVDEERGGLMMFENDLKAGTDVQLMRRNIDFDSMEDKVNQLYERIGDREPILALYVDCAGRLCMLTGTDEEEAAEIQRTVGTRTPLLGMVSAMEIAKVAGEVQPMNWTGVLCILSQ
ncbi:MAG: FIST C-terminal domain-containing protein, partial [Acidimicrobiia bacterium]